MVGETNSMVDYPLMAEGHSTHLGVWRFLWVPPLPPAGPEQRPSEGKNFLRNVLNLGLIEMFEKLKKDTF